MYGRLPKKSKQIKEKKTNTRRQCLLLNPTWSRLLFFVLQNMGGLPRCNGGSPVRRLSYVQSTIDFGLKFEHFYYCFLLWCNCGFTVKKTHYEWCNGLCLVPSYIKGCTVWELSRTMWTGWTCHTFRPRNRLLTDLEGKLLIWTQVKRLQVWIKVATLKSFPDVANKLFSK